MHKRAFSGFLTLGWSIWTWFLLLFFFNVSLSPAFYVGSEPGFGCNNGHLPSLHRPHAGLAVSSCQPPAKGCSCCGCVRACWGRGVTVGSVVAAYLPCHRWASERTDWPSSCPTEGLARPLTEETKCPETQHTHTHTYLIEITTFSDTYTQSHPQHEHMHFSGTLTVPSCAKCAKVPS